MGLLDSLVRTESGGNWQAQNNVAGAGGMSGHFGRLQFGQARLQDAMRAGVLPQGTTPDQFMANPQLQQAVEQWHFGDIDQQAQRMGLNRYVGQEVGGMPITQDAIRAMAHLGGIGGAQRFLESGGQYNPSDAYGTSLADYARTHGAAGGISGGSGQTQVMGQQGGDTLAGPTEDTSIWRNSRLLGDPDRRARLQIGLEGMTLNPNQAIMQGAQAGIDQRAGDARMNETAAWLNAQPGGGQFAQALAAGIPADQVFGAYMQSLQAPAGPEPIEINGQLVDPSTGQVIGDYRDPSAGPDQTSAMQNYDFLIAQGVAPDQAMSQAFGGGGVNVTVGSGENAFNQETGKALAQEAAGIVAQGATAQRALGTIGNLRSALQEAPQGAAGAITKFAGDLGIKTEGSSQVEVVTALVNQLVPQQRPPGSGTMSDRDVQLFLASLPQLINTPGGNEMIIQAMQSVLEYDVVRAGIARQLQLRKITPEDADQAYAALGNPLADFAKPATASAEPATDTAAPAPPVPTGANITPEEWGRAWQNMTPDQRVLFQ